MEDYKPFKIVSVLRDGKATGITSAYDAAEYILEKWPDGDGGQTLGSGLIDQSQKVTMAAMTIAAMNVWAQRS